MKIPLYQVDAFTNRLFRGNPAAVCPLEEWLEDQQMQAIAAENNLAETAFLVSRDDHYDLRWFTPVTEVDLCGHATLASAYMVFQSLNTSLTCVEFSTKSGMLTVEREGSLLSMNFPSRPASSCDISDDLVQALGAQPAEVLLSQNYLVVYESEEVIRSLRPDMSRLLTIDCFGFIVTARGNDVDFVSRFFAPKAGIPEDPVTGSAHCTLVPYWAEKLSKTKLHALQLSQREGELFCENLGDRVKISGHAVIYSEGFIYL